MDIAINGKQINDELLGKSLQDDPTFGLGATQNRTEGCFAMK
jgi:hypothetical protein